MRFGSVEIPGSLFKLARGRMLNGSAFTPAEVRAYLVEHGKADMRSVNDIERNHEIIAERVLRAVIDELRAAEELVQLKRGLWIKNGPTAQAPAAIA